MQDASGDAQRDFVVMRIELSAGKPGKIGREDAGRRLGH